MHAHDLILSMVLTAASVVCLSVSAPAQELVFSTGSETSGPGPLVLFPNLGTGLAGQTPIFVAPALPYPINPHGFSFLGPTTVVASKIDGYHSPDIRVDIIDLANDNIIASFNPGGATDTAYSGYGTVIVNPSGSHLLLAAGHTGGGANASKLWIVPTPLSALSVASDILILPGSFGTFQTHAIAFDHGSGRAYVAHSTGITAIDPPYMATNVAFTISLPDSVGQNGGPGRAVELSPDKSTLLTTTGGTSPGPNLVSIIHAPFSAASTHEDLTIDQAFSLDAVAFTPDGNQALVVDETANPSFQAQVFAISAPYSATSSVEWLQFPANTPNFGGFEDLDISPDGQIAALAGGCLGAGCPLAILHAPFTATGFSVETMNLPLFGLPYNSAGRGAGTVHFWPTSVSTLPQITIDRISVTEGNSGTKPATFTVSLSNRSTQTISVDYATANGNALAGTDYIATSGTLSFAPGQTRRTVVVSVIGDTVAEADEQFHLGLSNPVNATLLYSPTGPDGTCIIVDDDSGNPYIVNDSPLPDAYVGVPYSQTFMVANYAPAAFWIDPHYNTELPSGLALDAASGVLSGAPEQAGSYYTTVDVLGVVGREYHLTVLSDRIFADSFEARP